MSVIQTTISHQFKASAESVFDAWLDPDKVRVWFSAALQSLGLSGEIAQIEIDPKVDGTFLFSDMRDGVEARHWGTYLEMERPGKIVFTWNTVESDESDPIKIALTIEPEGDGCVANILNEMGSKWANDVPQAKAGWSRMLEAIEELLNK